MALVDLIIFFFVFNLKEETKGLLPSQSVFSGEPHLSGYGSPVIIFSYPANLSIFNFKDICNTNINDFIGRRRITKVCCVGSGPPDLCKHLILSLKNHHAEDRRYPGLVVELDNAVPESGDIGRLSRGGIEIKLSPKDYGGLS